MPEDNHATFAELYSRCHLPLLRYVMTMLPNRAIAEDIVQETAKNLWEKFDQSDQSQPFLPWARKFAYFETLNQRRKLAILTAPEERLGHAAAPDMSLSENAFLTARSRQRLDLNGFIKRESTVNFARAVIEQFDVRTTGPDQPARALSGGNLQKFVVGREVMQSPRVLVVNQPTWGVDAAAASAIHDALRELADSGAGVLVISQDLDELMEMADTIAILADGRLSQPSAAATLTVEAIGQMMEGRMGLGHVQA